MTHPKEIDTRSPNQIAISQGLKFAWKRRKAAEAEAGVKRKKNAVKPKISEATLHKQVADYLDMVVRPPAVWTTIAHGGGGRIRGAMLKARGLKRGWPDIIIITRGSHGPVVLGIELKREGGGSQTADQRAVQDAFNGCKAWYAVCRSLEAVQDAVAFVLNIPAKRAA